jgi:hypothetical protein
MRKKLIALAFALGAGWYALSSPTPAAAAGKCSGFQVCCPDGRCFCCIHPCSPQCP